MIKFANWILALFATVCLLAAPLPQSTGKSGAGSKMSANAPDPGSLVDINSASVAQLKELPGIGDVYANAIVKGRPYANKSQLVSRKIIPQAIYNKISSKIIASQKKK
ncbi:MAG TPA: helix-hairpin-helix domain-containing protein [Bryobacteraceae bacterium]|nr:helix-hairpin-helix domain-containing protein [Bryobacteraceae bacterium]